MDPKLWYVFIFLMGDGGITTYRADMPPATTQAGCVNLISTLKMSTAAATGIVGGAGAVTNYTVAAMCLPGHTPLVVKYAPPFQPLTIPVQPAP